MGSILLDNVEIGVKSTIERVAAKLDVAQISEIIEVVSGASAGAR